MFDTSCVPPQPKWKFTEELRRPRLRVWRWKRRAPEANEADLRRGVRLERSFADPEGLLDTAYAGLERFFALGRVRLDGAYRIAAESDPALPREAYRIETGVEGCRIAAADTEGVRRALYFLEDRMTAADGPFLPLGGVTRIPVVKSRISRCFFGPLKRPPFFRDELLDAEDYYPEEYLATLAHEGVNGLWLTIDFKSLARTSLIEGDEFVEQRREKLCQIVGRCRKYGIRIYLFCTEPIAFDSGDPILEAHPELGGTAIPGKVGFCPSSETAQRYLYEVTHDIFSGVPHLGGMIILSVGEWYTLCCNATSPEKPLRCPRCGDKPYSWALGQSLGALRRGMADAAPESELISWPYTQVFSWGAGESVEAARHLPPDVALMHNFESFGSKPQLGKTREITDYWLSYVGPSPFYEAAAKAAREAGTAMFAKLQVGCSHECATTQYIPVPLNLYRKYREMHRLGVSGVMQCWYFGAYPSLMTQAAGLLSFAPLPRSEQAFLRELARLRWGDAGVDEAVKAWRAFSRAYDHYPLSNAMGYVGPMHDSVAWKLHLKPVNRRLTPSWLLNYAAPGDRVAECFNHYADYDHGFTLDEIVTLTERLARGWEQGLRHMRNLAPLARDEARRREIGVAEAAGLLFRAAADLFRFYQLREQLIRGKGVERMAILRALKRLLRRGVEQSRSMLELMRHDPTLGFHSEAEGYKFTPALLRERIAFLNDVLKREVPACAAKIRAGLPLYGEYTGEEPRGQITADGVWTDMPVCGAYRWVYQGAYPDRKFTVRPDAAAPESAFRARRSAEGLELEVRARGTFAEDRFTLQLEARPMNWHEELTVTRAGQTSMLYRKGAFEAEVRESADGWSARIFVPWSAVERELPPTTPIRLNVERTFEAEDGERTLSWVEPHPLPYIFVLGGHNPDDFGWLK